MVVNEGSEPMSRTSTQRLDHSIIKSPEQKNKNKFKMVDPYFCHFLLLSQSYKISENKDIYFNIDIKPHYL